MRCEFREGTPELSWHGDIVHDGNFRGVFCSMLARRDGTGCSASRCFIHRGA